MILNTWTHCKNNNYLTYTPSLIQTIQHISKHNPETINQSTPRSRPIPISNRLRQPTGWLNHRIENGRILSIVNLHRILCVTGTKLIQSKTREKIKRESHHTAPGPGKISSYQLCQPGLGTAGCRGNSTEKLGKPSASDGDGDDPASTENSQEGG